MLEVFFFSLGGWKMFIEVMYQNWQAKDVQVCQTAYEESCTFWVFIYITNDIRLSDATIYMHVYLFSSAQTLVVTSWQKT